MWLIKVSEMSSIFLDNACQSSEILGNDSECHFCKNLAKVPSDFSDGLYVSALLFRRSTLEQKSSLFGTKPTLVTDVGKCSGFAVDWETDRIYWANCESIVVAIMYCNISTCNDTAKVMIRPGDPVNINDMVIDPYEKLVKYFYMKCKQLGVRLPMLYRISQQY